MRPIFHPPVFSCPSMPITQAVAAFWTGDPTDMEGTPIQALTLSVPVAHDLDGLGPAEFGVGGLVGDWDGPDPLSLADRITSPRAETALGALLVKLNDLTLSLQGLRLLPLPWGEIGVMPDALTLYLMPGGVIALGGGRNFSCWPGPDGPEIERRAARFCLLLPEVESQHQKATQARAIRTCLAPLYAFHTQSHPAPPVLGEPDFNTVQEKSQI